jgi:hypothetical protein
MAHNPALTHLHHTAKLLSKTLKLEQLALKELQASHAYGISKNKSKVKHCTVRQSTMKKGKTNDSGLGRSA